MTDFDRRTLIKDSSKTPGYIYALINASMPGLVKIGFTAGSPEKRAADLSSGTGVPSPFIVAYSTYVQDGLEGERFVHRSLQEQGHRFSTNREFFEAPLDKVIRTISAFENSENAGPNEREEPTQTVDEINELLKEALRLADQDPILNSVRIDKCLETAIRLGSGEACYRLAEMYCDDGADRRADEDKVFSLWKRGAALGHAECYYRLGGASLWGSGRTLQDVDEAIRLYEQAARLGSWKACQQLCEVYNDDSRGVANPKHALHWAKEGVQRGGAECYISMADLYLRGSQWPNAEKCYVNYFASEEFQNGENVGVASTYLSSAALVGAVPKYLDALLNLPLFVRAKIVVHLEEEIASPFWGDSTSTVALFRHVREMLAESMGTDGAVMLSEERERCRQLEKQLGYSEHGGMRQFLWNLINGRPHS